MRGRLLPLVVVSVVAHAQVSLQLTPAAPVKGRDTEAVLNITTTADRPAPPVLRANVGVIEAVERLAPGQYRARYVLPATRAPEVAIIVAFAPWPHPQSVDGAFGVLRVPMASAVEVPGRAEPGAEVRIKLGDATFGPVRAQGDGSFRLPLVVPPGFGVATTTTVDRVGNKRSAKLDLMLPRVDQLACVATPTTLPADGVSKARVLCASSDQHGGATRGAKVRWSGGHGTWSAAKELGDGVQEWTWTAPRELGTGVETLRASWKQRAVDSSEEVRISLSQGPVRTLQIEAEDRVGEGDLAGVLPVEGRDFEIHDQAPLLGCGAHGGRTRSVCRGAGLDGVTNDDPGTLGARDCALDEDETALFVGGDDFEVLGGDARLAHVAGHALALPDLARILVVTRRTVRTVRNGNAVRCTKTAEVVALHGTGETLTDRGAGNVDELAGDEVAGGQFRADVDEVVFRNAELDELGLRLDACGGKLAAQRLCRVLHLGRAGAELDSRVAVLFLRTLGNDLDVVQSQYCYRDVLTCVVIDASHPYFLCNHT